MSNFCGWPYNGKQCWLNWQPKQSAASQYPVGSTHRTDTRGKVWIIFATAVCLLQYALSTRRQTKFRVRSLSSVPLDSEAETGCCLMEHYRNWTCSELLAFSMRLLPATVGEEDEEQFFSVWWPTALAWAISPARYPRSSRVCPRLI